MRQAVDTYLIRFSKIAGSIFLAAGVLLFFLYPPVLITFIIAYAVSFAFTGSNFLVIRKMDLQRQGNFAGVFGASIAIRFLLVMVTLIIVLATLKNHQFFFTVSFIISYICHSVIEIIFLNKILETDTQK